MEDELEAPAPSGFFPSINQFRSAVKAEREWAAFHNVEPRVRPFRGTVKLHGTNAGITRKEDGSLVYRSRTREITPEDDNAGFARHMAANEPTLLGIFNVIEGDGDKALFGEWCGAGVQSSVGISAESKMFVVFGARVGESWIEHRALPAPRTLAFSTFTITPLGHGRLTSPTPSKSRMTLSH